MLTGQNIIIKFLIFLTQEYSLHCSLVEDLKQKYASRSKEVSFGHYLKDLKIYIPPFCFCALLCAASLFVGN